MVHAFVADDAVFFSLGLPAAYFVAAHDDFVAQQTICNLPELRNPVDDLLSFPLMNRYFERLLARRGPEKGDCQFVSDVCLWLRMLRRYQGIEQLLRLGGRLETGK